ncbi:hypothetical protein Vafri_9572 [Volvox africanus]|uniref:Glutathione S-transferase C-terminal domain-containing protein n=1 Tax=Volvox africanus TaxID=51714 RepID=A0A8J4B4T4_9CHLO|nr:hypothetical protein Vafri_9572 [Volvox africanus]
MVSTLKALNPQCNLSQAALRQQIPPGLRWLGLLGTALTAAIARWLRDKYREESSRTSLTRVLDVFREAQAVLRGPGALGPDGERHLVGGALSYADIAMAVAVQALKPFGPSSAASARPPLKVLQPYQAEFADLIAWRDALFAKYFPTDTKSD